MRCNRSALRSNFAIQASHLRKAFGSKLAVKDLALCVKQGEVLGFLGPNGAGKSTSMKMLLGLVKPTDGTAQVLGQPIGNVRARASVGFLPEHFRFQDWLTGREFLRFHGRLFGMSGHALSSRIEALLRRVDLVDAAGQQLRTYSKGMLQRVGLAQAMLNRPKLIFLDEPTSGLDPLGRLMVRDVINDLRSEGTTVFLNSHLLSEVEVTCDRVVFIKQGEVVREVDLHQHNDHEDVELRLGEMAPRVLRGLAQFGQNIQVDGLTVRMRVADESQLPHIAAWLVGQGAQIYALASRKRSLESLFLEVLGDERMG